MLLGGPKRQVHCDKTRIITDREIVAFCLATIRSLKLTYRIAVIATFISHLKSLLCYCNYYGKNRFWWRNVKSSGVAMQAWGTGARAPLEFANARKFCSRSNYGRAYLSDFVTTNFGTRAPRARAPWSKILATPLMGCTTQVL